MGAHSDETPETEPADTGAAPPAEAGAAAVTTGEADTEAVDTRAVAAAVAAAMADAAAEQTAAVGTVAVADPQPEPPQPRPRVKFRNAFGWVAVVVGITGLALAFLPTTVIIGWLLLLLAFICGIIGLSLAVKAHGVGTAEAVIARATTIAAIIISIVGIVVGVNTFLGSITTSFQTAFNKPARPTLPRGAVAENTDPNPDVPTEEKPADAGEKPSDAAENPLDTPEQPPGSRENPIPFGGSVATKEWKVTLGLPREAGREVAQQNSYNEPPDKGMEYWIVPVTAAYNGRYTGNPGFDITVDFVGHNNKTYDGPCGIIPDSLMAADDLQRGEVVTGNTCVAVPVGARGLWEVAPGFNARPVFFAQK